MVLFIKIYSNQSLMKCWLQPCFYFELYILNEAYNLKFIIQDLK
jgi:hypothetical protein